MPILRIKDNLDLKKNAYRILSYDKVLYEEELEEGDADAFRKMIDNVSAKCQEYYADILNKQIVKIMIDNIKDFFPCVVVGLVPEKIGYLQVQRKLQEMLREGKSIRDMLHILEELEEAL